MILTTIRNATHFGILFFALAVLAPLGFAASRYERARLFRKLKRSTKGLA